MSIIQLDYIVLLPIVTLSVDVFSARALRSSLTRSKMVPIIPWFVYLEGFMQLGSDSGMPFPHTLS